MDTSDSYLEVNQQDNRLFESLFRQIISTDKWSKPETHESIEESKVPAFCLKTKDLKTGQKLFVNFCHSPMMKPPTLDLNEEELRSLLASEDSQSFTIPLLIKPLSPTADKSGHKAFVCDVIINTDFYINKISFSQLYKTFLITVTLETIEKDKYQGIIEKNDWILLKNKKYQEVVHDESQGSCDKSLAINELSALLNINGISDDNNEGYDYEYVKTKSINNNAINGPKTDLMVTQVSPPETQIIRPEEGVHQINSESKDITPKYKLKLDVFNNFLEGQVFLPLVNDLSKIDLRIGEDRIVLQANNYKLDIFVPVLISFDQVVATFDRLNNVLNVKMPLN